MLRDCFHIREFFHYPFLIILKVIHNQLNVSLIDFENKIYLKIYLKDSYIFYSLRLVIQLFNLNKVKIKTKMYLFYYS